mgnify:CR=1 FL=1
MGRAGRVGRLGTSGQHPAVRTHSVQGAGFVVMMAVVWGRPTTRVAGGARLHAAHPPGADHRRESACQPSPASLSAVSRPALRQSTHSPQPTAHGAHLSGRPAPTADLRPRK